MSWLDKLEKAKAEIAKPNVDPWRLPLERVRGKIDYDGIERVTTQLLLDVVELGWTAVRVRARTRADYLEQVRGYCRDTRNGHCSTEPDRDRTPVGSSAPV